MGGYLLSPPPPLDQITTAKTITQINAFLFLSYQWTWHQQQPEVAVVMGAVVEAACVQQYAAVAAWVRQRAACVCVAAGGGGRGNDCNGRPAASVCASVGSRCGVRAAVGSGCGMPATACSGGGVCVAAGGSSQQHNCNGRQRWQRLAGGTFAMGSSGGGGSGGANDSRMAEKL